MSKAVDTSFNHFLELKAKFHEDHPNFKKECKWNEVRDIYGNVHKQPGECQSYGYSGCGRMDCPFGCYQFSQFSNGSICKHPALRTA